MLVAIQKHQRTHSLSVYKQQVFPPLTFDLAPLCTFICNKQQHVQMIISCHYGALHGRFYGRHRLCVSGIDCFLDRRIFSYPEMHSRSEISLSLLRRRFRQTKSTLGDETMFQQLCPYLLVVDVTAHAMQQYIKTGNTTPLKKFGKEY